MGQGQIRDMRRADWEDVLRINAENQPEVGSLDETKLAWFAEYAPVLRVVESAGVPVGFFIGLTDEQSDYVSPNYRWFADRYEIFAYVDRIALNPAARGQGFGPQFYGDFESWARASGKPVLAAEVNTQPPNPRSLRFHRISGFTEVGRTRPYGPEEEVAMFIKDLSDPS